MDAQSLDSSRVVLLISYTDALRRSILRSPHSLPRHVSRTTPGRAFCHENHYELRGPQDGESQHGQASGHEKLES